jgi:hypothetical protein
MRTPLIASRTALLERLRAVGQVDAQAPEAEMPPYMESFLAHLRLLVGVPFEYFIPDPRLLPDESIRFFYLDRSWCDRLVDGALTVGKIGSREQAHHQALAAKVSGTLDVSERMVRSLQRGKDFAELHESLFKGQPGRATLVTGFVMRSAAVSGWPHMEVCAYRQRIAEPFDAGSQAAIDAKLPLLRLERLSAGVLFALWQGVPELVTLEEPHHGVQFGIQVSADGQQRTIPLRSRTGQLLSDAQQRAITVPLPTRARHGDVIDVLKLRDALQSKAQNPPPTPDNTTPIVQSGPAAFAIAVLDPPWRQRFEGTEDRAGDAPSPTLPGFVVSDRVRKATLKLAVEHVYRREE